MAKTTTVIHFAEQEPSLPELELSPMELAAAHLLQAMQLNPILVPRLYGEGGALESVHSYAIPPELHRPRHATSIEDAARSVENSIIEILANREAAMRVRFRAQELIGARP
ncbi:MAG: hypothetical protein JWP85_2810 [Rhodoglobus sp.]|nr:hypothetical protein [Rhodoglobus sp.]